MSDKSSAEIQVIGRRLLKLTALLRRTRSPLVAAELVRELDALAELLQAEADLEETE